METIDMINQTDFLALAQSFTPDSGTDVYFYTLNNEGINIRKTVVNDFNTWVVVYNHYEGNISMIIVGAPPVDNDSRYTLVEHLLNVVRPEPVVAEPEEIPAPSEAASEETPVEESST
jgi:hypothetical protein